MPADSQVALLPVGPFAGAQGLFAGVGDTPLVSLRRLPYPQLSAGVEIRLKLGHLS
jgi:hypothetical protein